MGTTTITDLTSDEKALALHQEYRPVLEHHLLTKTLNHFVVDEIVQVTFSKLFRVMGSSSEPLNVHPWLIRVADNALTDYWRRERRWRESLPIVFLPSVAESSPREEGPKAYALLYKHSPSFRVLSDIREAKQNGISEKQFAEQCSLSKDQLYRKKKAAKDALPRETLLVPGQACIETLNQTLGKIPVSHLVEEVSRLKEQILDNMDVLSEWSGANSHRKYEQGLQPLIRPSDGRDTWIRAASISYFHQGMEGDLAGSLNKFHRVIEQDELWTGYRTHGPNLRGAQILPYLPPLTKDLRLVSGLDDQLRADFGSESAIGFLMFGGVAPVFLELLSGAINDYARLGRIGVVSMCADDLHYAHAAAGVNEDERQYYAELAEATAQDDYARVTKRMALAGAWREIGRAKEANELFRSVTVDPYFMEMLTLLDDTVALRCHLGNLHSTHFFHRLCEYWWTQQRFDEARRLSHALLKVASQRRWLLDIALASLCIGMTTLLESVCRGRSTSHSPDLAPGTRRAFNRAVKYARFSGKLPWRVVTLLCRARFRSYVGNHLGAIADVWEAGEVAELTGMWAHAIDAGITGTLVARHPTIRGTTWFQEEAKRFHDRAIARHHSLKSISRKTDLALIADPSVGVAEYLRETLLK